MRRFRWVLWVFWQVQIPSIRETIIIGLPKRAKCGESAQRGKEGIPTPSIDQSLIIIYSLPNRREWAEFEGVKLIEPDTSIIINAQFGNGIHFHRHHLWEETVLWGLNLNAVKVHQFRGRAAPFWLLMVVLILIINFCYSSFPYFNV